MHFPKGRTLKQVTYNLYSNKCVLLPSLEEPGRYLRRIFVRNGDELYALMSELCVMDHLLKVKCNEIWTIFLFSKNLHKEVSYTNKKQNQLLKISFVRTMAPKTRKSDDFRELHENQPEMAALGVETKL